MRHSSAGNQLPELVMSDTKANIEALVLTAGDVGAQAYATDTEEPGWYNGAAWTWGAGGGGDASDITYTPAVDADWDGGIDPGNADHAFDQLAERTKDLEGLETWDFGPTWNIDGALAVLADVGEQWIMPEQGVIVEVIAVVKENGSANATIVDVNKNGVTIFTNQANRPEIAHDDGDNYDVGVPDVTAFAQYDEFTLDIDAVATDATDLRVIMVVSGLGGAGGLGDVVGPAGATDNAVARYDTGTGKLIQDSLVLIRDEGGLVLPDDADEPPLNVTARAAEPTDPVAEDLYLDDGSNTASGDPGWRRYTGAAWEDVSAGAGGGGGADLLNEWNYRGVNVSGSAYTFKGNRYVPSRDITMYAIAYFGNVLAGSTYKAIIITIGGGLVATIENSESVTMANPMSDTTAHIIWLRFSSPVALTAGTSYGFLVGRTDGAGNYGLPCCFLGSAQAPFESDDGLSDHARIAVATPIVGSAVTVGTSDNVSMGFQWAID